MGPGIRGHAVELATKGVSAMVLMPEEEAIIVPSRVPGWAKCFRKNNPLWRTQGGTDAREGFRVGHVASSGTDGLSGRLIASEFR